MEAIKLIRCCIFIICFLFYVRWYCNAYSGNDLFIHLFMEAIKLILALVMLLLHKRFTNFMLKDVNLNKVQPIKVNGKLQILFTLKILLSHCYLHCFKMLLLFCINGLYCLTMIHLIWHNVIVSIIAFLLGGISSDFKLTILHITIIDDDPDKFY